MAKNSENLAIVYDNVTIDASSLGATAAVAAASKIDASRGNGFRIMKTEYWVSVKGLDDHGPIMVGFSAIFDASGVESCIESDPQDSSEDTNNFLAKRPVWPLKMFVPSQADASGNYDNVQHDKSEFNPRWSVPEGENAYWWVYNMTTALDAACTVNIFAKHYGVWLRD